ncbi:Threonylcarbamoyl-AMP synthase [bacterium HR39]|nr:Threonylcarbamoyl-AMP synthase [bacterium HR39]
MKTEVLKADAAGIARAAEVLRAGGLVAFPTETVYGLGGVATRDEAVERIFTAKGRPSRNPLIAHVGAPEVARRIAVFDERAERLVARFWPGPLTIVLPRRPGSGLSPRVSAGLPTVAVRMPAHPVALALLRAVDEPVAAPSANRSGRTSPTTAEHVLADLAGRIELVLDAGPCEVGVESTVVDLSEPDRALLLRPGGLPRAEIEAVIGPLEGRRPGEPVRSPGLVGRHYAPSKPVRLDVREVAPDEGLLAFGEDVPPGAKVTLNLSPAGDLAEAARSPFAMLRELDRADVRAIAVVPIPGEGLGEAIRDRLRRAAMEAPADA